MLACARALLANPDLLLMDEPSEGLAPQKLQELGDLIERLSASGLAILLVEQNMRFALRYCNHVYVMHRGGIGFEGSPQALIDDVATQERLLAVGSTEQA
jgi:branched-chain amino acid transport system ATP-binding protein